MTRRSCRAGIIVLLLSALISGCLSVPSVESRITPAQELTRSKGWHAIRLDTNPFELVSYIPKTLPRSDILTIYIEGDGMAWVTRTLPSKNPTPINPVALKLALKHPNRSAAYLSRPCQYQENTEQPACQPSLWSTARFSEAVVSASNQAISQLKARASARQVVLVGFSGGGAIAALVAARRDDVHYLVTIAGNLDHEAWTKEKRVTPLNKSLNPADAWQQLASIPQLHWIGEKDQVISRRIIESYRSRFPVSQRPAMRILKDTNHHCCWEQHWPALLPRIVH